jgi:hypothetical protein
MRSNRFLPASAWGSEMSRALIATLIVIASGMVSCSDIPTAPKPPQAPLGNITVGGTITDRDGPGVVAFLSFRPLPLSPGQPSPYFAVTNGSGAFQVSLPQGTYEVRVQPDYLSGLPSVTVPKFEVSGTGSQFNYRYSGTRVTGSITGPGGSLLGDAYVTASSGANQIYLNVRASNGHYSMLLPPGNYELYGEPGIYDGGIPTIEVEANITSADTTINLDLTGNVVTVTATLGGSTPLANVGILANSDAIGVRATARSRLDGSAVLYLPSGGYSFTAVSPDGSIVGPETGYWSISGDTSIPIDFPGTRWDVTLRRTADNSALPFTSIYAFEIGSGRYASTTSDLLGRFQVFVRPNQGYDLQIQPGGQVIFVPNISSGADSTFDILVNAPVP